MSVAQQEIGALKAKLKVIETENYELKLHAARKVRTGKNKISTPIPSASTNSVTPPASSAASDTVPTPDTAAVSFIKRLGRYTQQECTPVIPLTAFGIARPTFRHDHPDRYTDANIALGFTADLYSCVPFEYHAKILSNSESFRTIVSH